MKAFRTKPGSDRADGPSVSTSAQIRSHQGGEMGQLSGTM